MARQLEHFDNLVSLFLTRAAEKGDAAIPVGQARRRMACDQLGEAARQVASLAASLKRIGLQPGDRVALVSENRPEWLIADLAIMAAGCVTVPTYTTNTTRDHAHVLGNSGARAVIVSNQKLAKNLMPAVLTSSECHHVIGMEEIRSGQTPDWVNCPQLDEAGVGRSGRRRAAAGRSPASAATTSPASSTPAAPAARRAGSSSTTARSSTMSRAATDIISTDFGWADEVFLSFLPASHAYEHSGGQHFPIALGAQIYYAESLEKLAANIEEVQPTIMVVVPRLFELLRARIMKSIESNGGLSKYLLAR